MICQFKFCQQVTVESGLFGKLFGCFPSRKLSLFCCLLQPLIFSVEAQLFKSTVAFHQKLLYTEVLLFCKFFCVILLLTSHIRCFYLSLFQRYQLSKQRSSCRQKLVVLFAVCCLVNSVPVCSAAPVLNPATADIHQDKDKDKDKDNDNDNEKDISGISTTIFK